MKFKEIFIEYILEQQRYELEITEKMKREIEMIFKFMIFAHGKNDYLLYKLK